MVGTHKLVSRIASADANRSCGPPKPGRLLLNRVRRCRRRSAGGPLGPDGAPEGPWGRRRVPYGSVHQLCTNTGQSSDPSGDYMLRAALVVTHFFLGENRHAQNIIHLLVYCNSPKGYAHSNCTAILCKGVWSIRKVTVPLSKPIAMRYHK